MPGWKESPTSLALWVCFCFWGCEPMPAGLSAPFYEVHRVVKASLAGDWGPQGGIWEPLPALETQRSVSIQGGAGEDLVGLLAPRVLINPPACREPSPQLEALFLVSLELSF